jgi:sialidase-1
MKMRFVVGLMLPFVSIFAEEAPQFTPVFDAGKAGYALYRIPGIVVTAKGSILAYCEARKTGASDWGRIDVLMRRSADGGAAWSEPHNLCELDPSFVKNPVAVAKKLSKPEDITIGNPVAVSCRNGSVLFIHCVENMRAFCLRSDDDGMTFGKRIEITKTFDDFRPEYDWKVFATGPGHGTELKSGRLIVPFWMSVGTGSNGHRPSAVATIYSDDAGVTWKRGAIVCNHPDPLINPSETAAVELSDGRVMLNIRSESKANRRAVCFSPDGASNWTKPQFVEDLKEPICMASLARLSDPPRLLFSNPDNLEGPKGKVMQPGQGRERRNLSIKMSTDDGKTWPVSKVLDGGISAYSDLAVLPDGKILCFYEKGGAEGSMYKTQFLMLAKFSTEWLTSK